MKKDDFNSTSLPSSIYERYATLNLQVEYLPLHSLKPNRKNPRKRPPKQIRMIAASYQAHDFINPVIIDENGVILAGHGRYEAAKLCNMKEVPVICVQHLTEEQKLSYMLADNQLSTYSDWDVDPLCQIIRDLDAIDYPMEFTGFETAQVDNFLIATSSNSLQEDRISELPKDYIPVTKLGDVWKLGPHLLVCGDATKIETYRAVLNGEKVELCTTDPPFNISVNDVVKKKNNKKFREFVQASGEMSYEQFSVFLRGFLGCTTECLKDGSIIYVFMDWRHISQLQQAAEEFFTLKQICVWNKGRGGLGSFYRSQHEFCCVFKLGSAPHINNFKLGESGRYRTNVWNYAPVRHPENYQDGDDLNHPTIKPVAMIADILRDCSQRNGIVLDPFGGSGSTLIAAERTKRRSRLIELDPIYCDLIVKRWERFTDSKAVLLSNGQYFEDVLRTRQTPLFLSNYYNGDANA